MSRSCISPWTDMCFNSLFMSEHVCIVFYSKWNHIFSTRTTLDFIYYWIQYVLQSWKHLFSTCVTLDFICSWTQYVFSRWKPLRRASGHYPKIVGKPMENHGFCSWVQYVLPSWKHLFSLWVTLDFMSKWLQDVLPVFFTLTIRSPMRYYPWTQNTTAVYSWIQNVNHVSSMCA